MYWITKELGFGALIRSDRKSQEIRTAVDDETIDVEHRETGEELIEEFISAALSLILKHGPWQVDKLHAVIFNRLLTKEKMFKHAGSYYSWEHQFKPRIQKGLSQKCFKLKSFIIRHGTTCTTYFKDPVQVKKEQIKIVEQTD